MRLTQLVVKNFRALEDVSVSFDRPVSIIVGPNAIGKTTVLEAIRLLKAVLAPRTSNETNQVLVSLGATSPHFPQRINYPAIAGLPEQPISITSRFALSMDELIYLRTHVDDIARSLVQAQRGFVGQNPATLVQFYSSEQGRAELASAVASVEATLDPVTKAGSLDLDITISESGSFTAVHELEAIFARNLEQRHLAHRTSFSYFPADRALPVGDQPLQLGSPEASAQIESYNSQPHTKYTRLKNTIFGAVIQGEDSYDELKRNFVGIFENVLRGRILDFVGVNDIGMLAIRIKDTESGRVFDIDGMSSGEKGLILMFLIIARSIENFGIVLLDEPELHLNPSVARDMLTYLVDGFAVPNNLQLIICTHSADIITAAFGREQCAVYHLKSKTELSQFRLTDENELGSTLARLGTSISDGLLYKATIFVEGTTDIELLQTGFAHTLRRFAFKDLGGRREVEKRIKDLQEQEKQQPLDGVRAFVFDLDNAPTELKSTNSVLVLQWGKRSIESFLLDEFALYDSLQEVKHGRKFTSPGELGRFLRDIAMRQIETVASLSVFEALRLNRVTVKLDTSTHKSVCEVAEDVWASIEDAKQILPTTSREEWVRHFAALQIDEVARLRPAWDLDCLKLADAKRVFSDFRREVQIGTSLLAFQLKIMEKMKQAEASGWKEMKAVLQPVIDLQN